MIVNLRQLTFFLLALSIFLSSCDNEPEIKIAERITLVDATSILKKTSAELESAIKASGLPVPGGLIQYDVEVFKVTYKTIYKDAEVTASGLVVIPKTNNSIGVVSFHHGTISANKDAPSLLSTSDLTLTVYAALASPGFIAVIPDYIGFGSSAAIPHPYYVEKANATFVIDNIKAAKELALENKIKLNGKLFLAGYSQGGYITMATHKYIEENGFSDFNLIASFPASGGYDVKGIQKYFFEQQNYDEPFYIAYVANSYKNYYGWSGSAFSDFFNAPYAAKIPNLFNGVFSGSQINDQLTNSIEELLTSDIRANINLDSKYTYITSALEENSLLDWTPTKPMFMYHGDLDFTVPYQNSVETYNRLIANGASPQIVTLTPISFATHATGVVPYLNDFINKLIALK